MVWTDFKFSLIKHAQDLWWLFDYCMLAYEHLRTLGTRWQLNIVLLVVCKCNIKEFNIWMKKYIYRADAGIVQNDEIKNSYILHKGFIKHAISLINTPTARPISHHPWGWEYSWGKVGDGGVKRWTWCSKTFYGLLKKQPIQCIHVYACTHRLQHLTECQPRFNDSKTSFAPWIRTLRNSCQQQN